MEASRVNELTEILQTAISPVVMISGVGLLVMSLTNRLARTTDRARALSKDIKESRNINVESLILQIKILYKRSKLLMFSIGFALGSIFFVSLLVISLFASYMMKLNMSTSIILFFALSLVSLITSLVLFIREITLSLNALKLEIRDELESNL